MKVLNILDSLYRAGAEMQALDVCRNAAANGLDMSFAALGGGALEEDFRNSGVEYIRLQRRLPVDPIVVTKLRKFIRRNRIDIVHGHQAVDGLHGYFAALGTGAKTVLTYHGHFPDQKNRLALRYLAPRMAANIACSQGLTPWLEEQGIDVSHFRIVHNGVDVKRLEYDGPSLRNELEIPPSAITFGMVAHFHPAPRKDQITLCKAFVHAARELPDIHLLIVGKPVGDEGLRKFEECQTICREGGVADRAHFVGQRDDIAKVIHGLDVCVLSSLHEGLPIALIEAMLSRKPTILSDIPPHLEASDSGQYAVMFKTRDASDLAGKISMLAHDQRYREELAAHAYMYAKTKFAISTHIASLKKLYSEVLDDQRLS